MALLQDRLRCPELTLFSTMKHKLPDDPAPDDYTYFTPNIERDSHVIRSQVDSAQERQDKAIRHHFQHLGSQLEEWKEDIVRGFDSLETGQDKLEQRLQKTEEGLVEVRRICQEIKSHTDDLVASSSNQRAYRARDPIRPLSMKSFLPRQFPKTVAEFWYLRLPKSTVCGTRVLSYRLIM